MLNIARETRFFEWTRSVKEKITTLHCVLRKNIYRFGVIRFRSLNFYFYKSCCTYGELKINGMHGIIKLSIGFPGRLIPSRF